jgi:hypothetical protein
MKRTIAVLVFVLGTLMSASGFAQSIGPDGRVLPAYSGRSGPPPSATPPPVVTSPPPTLPASTPAPAAAPHPAPAPVALVTPAAPAAPAVAPVATPAAVNPVTPVPPAGVATSIVAVVPRRADSHVLNDSEVAAAIERGHGKNPAMVGLSLLDMQTALLSGMACKTCGQSGYRVAIYTPVKWIEFQSALAKRELRPFSLADVTPEMREPILRVTALPSTANYITGQGLAGSSNVSRVVLADHTKQNIIQPLEVNHGSVEGNSAFRSVNYTSASASFNLSDVDQIRGEDDKGEFFVVVVGSNQNKYFKVKTRMFKSLF